LFQIERQPQNELVAGQVGYFIAGIKNISDVKTGDTDQNIILNIGI